MSLTTPGVDRYSSEIANDSLPQIDLVFVIDFAAATMSKYLECARDINPTVIYEVKSLLRCASCTQSMRGGTSVL